MLHSKTVCKGELKRSEMDSRFKEISMSNLKMACVDIINGTHKEFANSTRYSVVYNGQDLPPKAVISRGYYHATGKILPVQGENGFSGGSISNSFLKGHGFKIVPRPSDKTLKAHGKSRKR